jgi:hypothetical protein
MVIWGKTVGVRALTKASSSDINGLRAQRGLRDSSPSVTSGTGGAWTDRAGQIKPVRLRIVYYARPF